jgi:hypothetical protein
VVKEILDSIILQSTSLVTTPRGVRELLLMESPDVEANYKCIEQRLQAAKKE